MPQESLRSVVYRSFVTCEDPRGVVEGKTIRIYKTDSTKMSSRRIESELQSKRSKEKEKMSLVEVKNGAQKFNEAIDSWSKGANYRCQTKDIAKDLLKGALDLQESLMMLGKSQETSYITNLKKKREKPSDELSSRIGSHRFESFQLYDVGYEKERKLTNGSSRDCYAELRDVIREGLSKQNLLPNKSSYQESTFVGRNTEGLAGKRKLQLSPDGASTSSSRSSSMVYSTHEYTSSDSFSSRATGDKSKGSNLIAKLMGLDEFPSKPLPSSPQKQLDITSKIRPVFDIDLPNAKKSQYSIQKVNQEHMSLDEIIEMMQYKGLLRSYKCEVKQTSQSYRDDSPPIVLMRPHRLGSDNQKVKVYDNPIRKLHHEKANTEEDISVKRKPVENAKSANLSSKNHSLKQLKPQRSVLPDPSTKRTSSSGLSSNKSSIRKKATKIEKPILVQEVSQINSPIQDKTHDSEVTLEEIDNLRPQSLCEASEEDSDCVLDAVTYTNHSETNNNRVEGDVYDVNERKARILQIISNFQDSEPLFQDCVIDAFTCTNHSETINNRVDSDVYDVNERKARILHSVSNFQDSESLLQDCVNKFLEHENQTRSPFGSRLLLSRVCNSKNHTMREIAKGMENLKSYSMFSKESSNADTVSRYLERDIYLSTIGGTWSGWKDGFTDNEVEEFVLDLEKMVLNNLFDDILDILMDLVCSADLCKDRVFICTFEI